MKRLRIILYIVTLLLASTAVLSCSKGDMMEMDHIGNANEKSMVIMGSVSDRITGEALEDIAIKFKAYLQSEADKAPAYEETVYTDNKGTFTIHSAGADEKMICILTAEDKNGEYESQSQEIIITWEGTSFDRKSNTFIVNSCNFQL